MRFVAGSNRAEKKIGGFEKALEILTMSECFWFFNAQKMHMVAFLGIQGTLCPKSKYCLFVDGVSQLQISQQAKPTLDGKIYRKR